MFAHSKCSVSGSYYYILKTKKAAYKAKFGTSLVVQWLKLCTPNVRGLGSIPGQGIRSQMPLKIRHATMKSEDSTCHN